MKNVYDIRNQDKLYFILSDKKANFNTELNTISVGIFVNLYYEATSDWYFNRLLDISNFFHVYIISSKESILKKAKQKGFFVIAKKNRGRDLSALLVAAREKILSYEYVCFVHDKNSLYMGDEDFVYNWRVFLYDNVLSSFTYVLNVINTFEQKSSIGLLVPPETPSLKDWKVYGKDLWSSDFEGVKQLISDFHLNCNIDINLPPVSIGTVFWCKVRALRVLFEYDWKYNDFSEEPMPTSGTISHALERALPYFVQSEGFEIGTIMTENEARNRLSLHSDIIHNILPVVGKYFHANSIDDFSKGCVRLKKYEDLFNGNSDVYLFGAGKVGEKFLFQLLSFGYKPKGIIVSDAKKILLM